MAVYYHSNGGGNNRGGGDWSSWLPVIILFVIPSPVTWVVGFFLLVNNLKRGGKKTVKRHPYDEQREAWEQGKGEEARPGQQKKAASASAKKTAETAKTGKGDRGIDTGKVMTLVGAIVAAVFGLGALTTFVEGVSYGTLRYDLSGIVACAVFMAGGLVTLGLGMGKKRRAERYANYLAYIGANREVSLAHMAATFGVSVEKLCRDLRKMLSDGVLPTGYLDLAEGKLYLTEMGYRAPRTEEKKPEPETEPQPEQDDDRILREIRQVNGEIPDEVMSAKIDRIEEITRRILLYQKRNPEKKGQLRSFLNYYLPTTLKILRAYAQLEAQGIEGENISAAKVRIEGMMDQVVVGFEKQLDKLFRDDAMDIASDVKVLEDMLKKDGLSDGDGMTMTM